MILAPFSLIRPSGAHETFVDIAVSRYTHRVRKIIDKADTTIIQENQLILLVGPTMSRDFFLFMDFCMASPPPPMLFF
jgi:hypothetical protein